MTTDTDHGGPRRRPSRRVVLAVAIALLLLVAGGAAAMVLHRDVPGDGATSLQLLVSAHPDDELQAWGALDPDPEAYTVFVLMTQGERTRRCDRSHEAWANVGPSDRPDPMPDRPGGEDCARARIASWHRFLDGAAGAARVRIDRRDDLDQQDVRGLQEAWFGEHGARLVFAAPDGRLSVRAVRQQVRRALELRGIRMPDAPLRRVAVGGYHNTEPGHGAVYAHPDHRAVQTALRTTDLGRGVRIWIPVGADDPSATHTATLPRGEYDAMMRIEPDGTPVGWHQRAYRWLAFGGERGAWPVSELADHAPPEVRIWPRRQRFTVVEATP